MADYISYKIEGLHELITKLQNTEGWLEPNEMDKIVKQAAQPLVNKIKEGYIEGGHKKTGALVNSIEAFQRTRRKNDPYFTYYVGPRYTHKNSLFSGGGNAAHLLEYGTVARFRANIKAGGAGRKQGLKGVYGAKLSTGRVKPYGVIRRATDEYSRVGIEFMKLRIVDLIVNSAKKAGIAA